MSRSNVRACAFTSATFFAVPSIDFRDALVAVKKASQFRKANAWPVPDEPAFMMIGRVPP